MLCGQHHRSLLSGQGSKSGRAIAMNPAGIKQETERGRDRREESVGMGVGEREERDVGRRTD